MAGAPSWDDTTPAETGPPSWDDTTPVDHGLSERQKLSPIGKALSPITGYGETYGEMRRESQRQMGQGLQQMLHPTESINPFTHPEAHGLSDVLGGLGNVAQGGLGYISSPAMAAVRSIATQPIEDVTGIPREYGEFAAGMLAPEMLKLPVPGEARPPAAFRTPAPAMRGPDKIVRPTSVTTPEEFTPPARQVVPDVPRQTSRPDAGVDLLPADTPHALPPERRSLSAMGASGPLSDVSDETIAHMRNVMAEQGFNEHTLDTELEKLSEHHMFGEITPSMEADMGAAAAPPGPGKNEIRNSLRQRATEARERVQNVFNRAFGPNVNLAQEQRVLDIERQRAADPLYQRFRQTTITPTPELDALMPRLQASGALQAANRSLQLEGEPLSRGFIDFTGEPPTVQQVPTASAFQYAKEALDDQIGAAVKAGEKNQARRLVGLQKDLLSALDNHPQVGNLWRQARETYMAPTEIKNAQDFGKQVLSGKVDREELPFLTAAYSDAQMTGMRQGMRSYLENLLGKKDSLTGETIGTALSPNNIEKMQWAIGNGKTDELVNAMQAERHMHGAETRIVNGSPTAHRLEAQKRWTVEPGKGVTYGDVAGTIASPRHAVTRKVIEKGMEKYSGINRAKEEARMARLREEASRIFTLQGPERDAVARFLIRGRDDAPVPPPTRAAGGRVNDFYRARHAYTIKKQGGGELSDDDQAAMMPETFVNPAVKGLISGAAQQVATPGKIMQPNPYSAGSEEADWYDRQRQNVGEDWARNTALNTMGTGAIAGVPVKGGEVALGAGAVRGTKAAPEAPFNPQMLEDQYGPVGTHPKEQALTANDILHPDTPSLPARSRTVEDIAQELNQRGSAALRGLDVKEGQILGSSPRSDELISRALASEVKGAIDRGGNTAQDWYTKAIDEAMQHASTIHPELVGDPHQKMGFTASLAVTSQGETVSSNVRLAEQAYNYFKENGRFPTDIKAKNGPAMNQNFAKLNGLLDDLGPEGTRDFLHNQYTVKELQQAGHDVGGENMGTKVYGSSILGPKIGQGFYQNLNGNYDPVTMDLWFMRGWGRLTGTLVGRPAVMEKATQRLTDAMREEGMKVPRNPDKLAQMADDTVATHERDFINDRAAYDSGDKAKSELTLASERYLKNLRGINEQPTSGSQREWMRSRVNRAREILGQQGHNLTNADLQAIWWYPEKELYSKLGGRDSEAINTDYATAYRNLAAKRAAGQP